MAALLMPIAVLLGVIAICGMMNDSNNRYPGPMLGAALVLGLLAWILDSTT